MEKLYVIYDICVACGKRISEGEMVCPDCRRPPEAFEDNWQEYAAKTTGFTGICVSCGRRVPEGVILCENCKSAIMPNDITKIRNKAGCRRHFFKSFKKNGYKA